MNALDLDLIRSFLAVAEQGSFSAAAAGLLRTQAAVSQQIQRLEAQIGAPLFARTSRTVRLSPAGERLLSFAHQLLRLSAEATDAARGALPRRRLRIGATDDIAAYGLMPALAELRRDHPDLTLEIATGATRALLADLGTRLDLVIGLAAIDAGAGQGIADLPLGWAGGGDPLAAGPLALALYPEGCLMRRLALGVLDGAGLAWSVTVAAASVSVIERAAIAGLATGVLVRGLAAPETPWRTDLPALPAVSLRLFAADGVDPALAERLRQALVGLIGGG